MGWIGLSAIGHVILLSMGGGFAPVNVAFQPPLIADIQHLPVRHEAEQAISPPLLEPGSRTVSVPAETARAEPRLEPEPTRTAPSSALPLPLLFDGYLGPNDVDARAEPVNDVLLVYPWIEYRRKISGVVVITLLINERGGLDKVTVVEATPPGLFEDAALEAVNKLYFTPALKDGRPVKSRKTIEVVFDPSEHLNHPVAKP